MSEGLDPSPPTPAQLNEKLQAFGFLTEQFAQRTVQFGYAQRAITIAAQSYFDIMATDASKDIDWSSILTFAAFTALPEYVALAGLLKEIGGDDTFRKSSAIYVSALRSIGKSIDLGKQVADDVSGKIKKIAEYETANDVLKEAYNLVLREQAIEAAVLQELMGTLQDDSIGLQPLQSMHTFWNKAGLKTVTAKPVDELAKDSDILAELILYDLLHAYTKKYVGIEIAGSEKEVYEDGKSLEDVTDSRVSIDGLNNEQQRKIYGRFTVVPWKRIGRSPVADWDDLALSWDADIIYRPGKSYLKHFREWESPAGRARARGRIQ